MTLAAPSSGDNLIGKTYYVLRFAWTATQVGSDTRRE